MTVRLPNCIGRNADTPGSILFADAQSVCSNPFETLHEVIRLLYPFHVYFSNNPPFLFYQPSLQLYLIIRHSLTCQYSVFSFCMTAGILFFRKGKPPPPNLPMPGHAASDCGKSSSPLSSVFSASALSVCRRHLLESRKINPHGHRKTEMREEKNIFKQG